MRNACEECAFESISLTQHPHLALGAQQLGILERHTKLLSNGFEQGQIILGESARAMTANKKYAEGGTTGSKGDDHHVAEV